MLCVEGMPLAVPQGSFTSYWKVGGVESPGARAGGKETATKSHLSGSTGRGCQLATFREPCSGSFGHCCLGAARGAGCICPGILCHFWAGLPCPGHRPPPYGQQLWYWGCLPWGGGTTALTSPVSHAARFSRALSVAQASGFQRQCCYLKPLLFASLTPTATSCCRSM